MRNLIFLLLSFSGLNACVHAQTEFPTFGIKSSDLPKAITYKDKLTGCLEWKQQDTIHYVLLCETDVEAQKLNSDRSVHVYAYHYTAVCDSARLLWKVQDGIDNCEVDFHAYFIPGAFSVTDLDKDNTPEIWLMYSVACRGDVSPADLKIIMYEGQRKHAMRGTMLVSYGSERIGGDYTFNAAFNKASLSVRQYAQRLWQKHYKEKW